LNARAISRRKKDFVTRAYLTFGTGIFEIIGTIRTCSSPVPVARLLLLMVFLEKGPIASSDSKNVVVIIASMDQPTHSVSFATFTEDTPGFCISINRCRKLQEDN
jgi:hypothetical protein